MIESEGFRNLLRRAFGPFFRMLPLHVRRSIRAMRLRRIVLNDDFQSEEIEYRLLSQWLARGDTALDVGANFGSYSVKMSQIVGKNGLVFAFEPVPQTFSLLTIVLESAQCSNVFALNMACSNTNGLVSMCVPDDALSGENLYQASIHGDGSSRVTAVSIRVDDLPLPLDGLTLAKIDAEGHDAQVIEGMWNTINRLMPVLIVEHPPAEIVARLSAIGYTWTRQESSPNTVFLPPVKHA
jgi:FkbM family methyltransferase